MKIKVLKTHKSGYVNCTIKNAHGKKKSGVHILVATAFLEKKTEHNIVNHLDGVRNNNKLSNLEWTDTSGNIQHAHDTGLIKKGIRTSGRKIEQYTLDGNLIKVHESITKASLELNISGQRIGTACKNKVNTTGFIWKYVENDVIEGEIWKNITIEGFESYKVSNKGRVITDTNIILKPTLNNGYHMVGLHNMGLDKTILMHQLVGTMFIENPNNFSMVNHKNGIRSDNRVENLEWTDNSGNIIHAYETGLFVPHMRKIVQLTLDGQFIKTYNSIKEAKKEGFSDSTISCVCKGKNPQHKGFKWMYYEDYIKKYNIQDIQDIENV